MLTEEKIKRIKKLRKRHIVYFIGGAIVQSIFVFFLFLELSVVNVDIKVITLLIILMLFNVSFSAYKSVKAYVQMRQMLFDYKEEGDKYVFTLLDGRKLYFNTNEVKIEKTITTYLVDKEETPLKVFFIESKGLYFYYWIS